MPYHEVMTPDFPANVNLDARADQAADKIGEAIAKLDEAMSERFSDVFPATTLGGYFVASQSQPGVWYLLVVHHEQPTIRLACPCPHGRRITEGYATTACRHMKRLLAYTQAEEARLKRPAMEVNKSALVD